MQDMNKFHATIQRFKKLTRTLSVLIKSYKKTKGESDSEKEFLTKGVIPLNAAQYQNHIREVLVRFCVQVVIISESVSKPYG